MKKISALLLAIIMALSICSCGQTIADDRITVVCTVFSQYDWVKNIIGDSKDKFNLSWLAQNGSDIHSYQPTAQDIVMLSGADIVISIGGVSDDWAKKAVMNAHGNTDALLEMADYVSMKNEETVDGMQHEEHDGHDHGDGDGDEYDEHIWLSLKNAKAICRGISERIIQTDPDGKDIYENNLQNYLSELDSLDKRLSDKLSAGTQKPLIFADRFPFRYFTDDYDLHYYAAFPGCSAETEASFDTVIFLAKKIKSNNIKTVFTVDDGSSSIADTVIENSGISNVKTVPLCSLQAVSKQQENSGLSYLSAMTDNAQKIINSLSE